MNYKMLSVKQRVLLVFLFIFALIWQDTLIPKMAINGIMPDLLTYFVVFIALYLQPVPAMAVGAGIGLIEGLFIGKYIGLSLLAKAAMAFVACYIGSKFYKENYLLPLIVVFIASLVAGFVYILFSYVTGLNLPFLYSLFCIVLPQSIYTAIPSPLIFLLVYLVFIQPSHNQF